MLLAQTRRDHKETRARHSVSALNMKHTLDCVYWMLRDVVFLTYKMAAQTNAKQCLFCQLTDFENGRLRARACISQCALEFLYITLSFNYSFVYFMLSSGVHTKRYSPWGFKTDCWPNQVILTHSETIMTIIHNTQYSLLHHRMAFLYTRGCFRP